MPWIKLHASINTDARVLLLSLSAQAVAIRLWLLLDDSGRFHAVPSKSLEASIAASLRVDEQLLPDLLQEILSVKLGVREGDALLFPAFAPRQERKTQPPVETEDPREEQRRRERERKAEQRARQRSVSQDNGGTSVGHVPVLSQDTVPGQPWDMSRDNRVSPPAPPSSGEKKTAEKKREEDGTADADTRGTSVGHVPGQSRLGHLGHDADSVPGQPWDTGHPPSWVPSTEKAIAYSAEDLLEALRQGGARVKPDAPTHMTVKLAEFCHQLNLTPERMRAIGQRLKQNPPDFWKGKTVTVTNLLGKGDGMPLTILVNECEEPPKPTPSKPGQGTGALEQIKRERAERRGSLTLGQLNSEVGRG